ncbi:DUF2069 domain-containing protein [Endozoicomonadaceae bacterium StTr2]
MTISDKARYALQISRIQYLAILAVIGLWTLWLEPPGEATTAVMIVRCTPLLLFLPFVFKNEVRPFLWLCFALTFYFISGVVNAMSGPQETYGLFLAVLSCGLFISAMMFARWKARA